VEGSDNLQKEGVPKQVPLVTDSNSAYSSDSHTKVTSSEAKSVLLSDFSPARPISRSQRTVQIATKLTPSMYQLLLKISYEKR